MKILFGILSCQIRSDLGSNQACRDTWLSVLAEYPNVDYKFFHGAGAKVQSDVIVVNAPDTWEGLAAKNQELQRYVCQRDYDFLFLCTDDTLVNVHRVMRLDFTKHDYMGCVRFHDEWKNHPILKGYINPSNGYWMSRRACETIAHAPLKDDDVEDLWVGKTLAYAGIAYTNVPAMYAEITQHGSPFAGMRDEYNPQWMYAAWRQMKNETVQNGV